jgi:hypothetical protein
MMTLLLLASLSLSNSVKQPVPDVLAGEIGVAGLSLDADIEEVESKLGSHFRKETAGPNLELYYHLSPSRTTVVCLVELKTEYVNGFSMQRDGQTVLQVGSKRDEILQTLGTPKYDVTNAGRRDLGYALKSGGTLHLTLTQDSVAEFHLTSSEWDSEIVTFIIQRAEENRESCEVSLQDAFGRLESLSSGGSVSVEQLNKTCQSAYGLSCNEAKFRNVAWRGTAVPGDRVALTSLTMYCPGAHHAALGLPENHPEFGLKKVSSD